MLGSVMLVAILAVTGEPGDIVSCNKMRGDEILASVALRLGPYDHSGKIEFILLPDEAGKVTFGCKTLPRS